MKKIALTQGNFALVDDEDFERLNKFKWHYNKEKRANTGYARRHKSIKKDGKRKQIIVSMHTFIMNTPEGFEVDHKDSNGLNNQKSNLRVCKSAQNKKNYPPLKGSSSKYKGVRWHKASNRFVAEIFENGKQKHLGTFKNEIDAAKAYDEKAKEVHGEFAFLNFPT